MPSLFLFSRALRRGVKFGGMSFLRRTGADVAGLGPRMEAMGVAPSPSRRVASAVLGPNTCFVLSFSANGGSSLLGLTGTAKDVCTGLWQESNESSARCCTSRVLRPLADLQHQEKPVPPPLQRDAEQLASHTRSAAPSQRESTRRGPPCLVRMRADAGTMADG